MAARPPRLYAIADLDFMAGDVDAWLALLRALDAAAATTPLWIQVRAASLDLPNLAPAARRARAAVRRATLLLNGPDSLAAAVGYDGVHWPERRLAETPDAPNKLPVASVSVHSPTAARQAERRGARTLVCGAVWTPSWKPTPGMGLDALRDVVQATALPVFAIGGITPPRCLDCRAAGAYGVAILSGICRARDPVAAVQRYASALSTPNVRVSGRRSASR